MSIQVRPGYTNPLTTMTHSKQGHTLWGKSRMADKAADLQTKQQQLQNTLLLMKSTGTDQGVSTVEQQEKLQAELEKVSEELRAIKNHVPQDVEFSQTEQEPVCHTSPSSSKLRMDTYEKGAKKVEVPGIYQLKREENSRYHISFIPYSE